MTIHRVLIAFLLIGAGVAPAYDPLNGDFSKQDPDDVRIMAYNTERNFIDNPSTDAAFDRILSAINPDLICFEEIVSGVSVAEMADHLNDVLPNGPGGWHVHFGLLGGTRNVIASRYPLSLQRTDTIPASSTRGVTIALADLPDATHPEDVYLLGVHLRCCGEPGGSEDASRQDSADAIANWLGDARGVARPSGDNISLPADTPMIALGDFNLVGGPQPEDTLLTGDIQDSGTYGPDVAGDWDVSDMTNLMPADPFTGDTFTWQGSAQFPPSALDRFIYTDSVAPVANSFILNTDTMSPAALAAAGLLAGDTLPGNTSDHLPIVMDLRLVPVVSDCNANGTMDADEIGAGQALLFDGSNDFVALPSSGPSMSLPDGNQPRTLEAWIRRDGASDDKGIMAYGNFSTGSLFGLILTFSCPDDLYFFGLGADLCSTGEIPMGQWAHVAATYDGAVVRLYLDGVEVAGAARTLNTVIPGSGFFVGKRPGASPFPWDGAIDEVRVWSVARTEEQIQAGMHSAPPFDAPGLVGYWTFDIDAGQFVVDMTGHGLDGTLGADAGAGFDEPAYVASEAPVRRNDCNANGVPDDCDVAHQTGRDCDGDGLLNECDADCNGNGVDDATEPEYADTDYFVTQLLATVPSPGLFCIVDRNGDCVLDSADIQPFVDDLLGP